MRTISKNSAHRNTYIERLNDERNKMARGGHEMRRKSEASDEIWKRGYNWKPTKERSDETRSGENRGITLRVFMLALELVIVLISQHINKHVMNYYYYYYYYCILTVVMPTYLCIFYCTYFNVWNSFVLAVVCTWITSQTANLSKCVQSMWQCNEPIAEANVPLKENLTLNIGFCFIARRNVGFAVLFSFL
jgi:hypothetical protein